jgi:glucose-1-phosphate cytidylyltransferase
MKVVILAGGFGTRLAEETSVRPKPMVEIGGQPILWHIMKIYASYGFKEFVIALGYKGEMIKDYFVTQRLRSHNLTVNLANGSITYHDGESEDWIVHLIDTGLETMTGGRVKRITEYIGNEAFMLTYGDGVADVDLNALLAFHRRQGRRATLTAVRPPARFGSITLNGEWVSSFTEKPQIGEGWINGGFFVIEPGFDRYVDGDHIYLEHEPFERLTAEGELAAYRHSGFWHCMDTVRDVQYLNHLWKEDKAPWKIWS